MKAQDEDSQDLVVKVKFFKLNSQENENRTRIKFIKKSGSLDRWYNIFSDMRNSTLNDILCAPEQPDLELN